MYSQDLEEIDSLWTKRGKVGLLLNQTGFSDWVGGGTNNFSGTLKFDNFQISYHNITNNGKRFILESGLSDLGESFTLPKYSILGSDLYIYHYLKVSWTFID